MGVPFVFVGTNIALAWLAFIVDRIVGDPPRVPHPVVGMGKVITFLERVVRPFLPGKRHEKVGGILCVVLIVGCFYGMTYALIQWISMWHPVAGFVVSVGLAATTVASKGLEKAAMDVVGPLSDGCIHEARRQVGHIVGRDTDRLDEEEILRATIETVAENTVDAIIAPLFYAIVGGAPLAIAYRAVNTLDSMWGYRNTRYIDFGWGAAKIDDVANWLPARISQLIYPLAAWIVGADSQGAWRTIKRDAPKHPSPNGGIPEAGVAGALGIRLGGWNTYDGRREFRAYMGKGMRNPTVQDVRMTLKMMHAVTIVFLIVITVMGVTFHEWD